MSLASDGQFDIRQDEHQLERHKDCIDLLVAAGYFRARIKGLTAFDQIVGGIVWCISVCNYSIDVDLLYSENSTIGQKIALTEKIVDVLKQLNCPHNIGPHQIQGLDFIHIFPVVQWLVKLAIEAKKEHGDDLESYVDFLYTINSGQSSESVLAWRYNELDSSLTPKRKYKRASGTKPLSMHDDALCTLAEYHETSHLHVPSVCTSANKENYDKVTKDDIFEESTVKSKISTKAIKQIFESIDVESSSLSLSYPTVGDELPQLDQDLQQAMFEEQMLSDQLSHEVFHQTQLMNELRELEIKMEKYGKLLASHSDSELCEFRDLLDEFDQISTREKEFKSTCRAKLAEMETELKTLSAFGEEKCLPATNLEVELSSSINLLNDLRLKLAEVMRRVVLLQRQLDSVPSQIELAQYQQRYIELYNQMASTHRYTKQYYTLYNTLVDVRNYMKKEIDLLTKIEDVLPMATKDAYRDSFIQNLSGILRGLEANYEKISTKGNALEKNKDSLNEEFMQMKSKERIFQSMVNKFKSECEHNENLRNILKKEGTYE